MLANMSTFGGYGGQYRHVFVVAPDTDTTAKHDRLCRTVILEVSSGNSLCS